MVDAWPHAYSPVLRPTPEWTFAGRPLVAVTVQFGAAAEQVDLYGLDVNDHPVRLAEMLAPAITWTTSRSGDLLLVVERAQGSALFPTCYAWRAGLQSAACPK